MKLDRLTSSTCQSSGPDAATAPASPWHVGPVQDASADRRRSRQQEMEEIEAKAIGAFEGQEQVLQSARDVAEKLTSLGPMATGLVRADQPLPDDWHAIDAKA